MTLPSHVVLFRGDRGQADIARGRPAPDPQHTARLDEPGRAQSHTAPGPLGIGHESQSTSAVTWARRSSSPGEQTLSGRCPHGQLASDRQVAQVDRCMDHHRGRSVPVASLTQHRIPNDGDESHPTAPWYRCAKPNGTHVSTVSQGQRIDASSSAEGRAVLAEVGAGGQPRTPASMLLPVSRRSAERAGPAAEHAWPPARLTPPARRVTGWPKAIAGSAHPGRRGGAHPRRRRSRWRRAQ